MKFRICLIFLAIVMISCTNTSLTTTQLTCEYLQEPLIDIKKPRLSWINIVDDTERGQVQTAWQIRVSSSKSTLSDADLWDSGKVQSKQSTNIKYQGKELNSHQVIWWQVRVWDRNDNVSKWSEPASWRMGMLDANEWKAKWIGAPWQGEEALPKSAYPKTEPSYFPPPAPLLRKSFMLEKKVVNAIAYVTGLGYFEFFVNGKKVGNDVLIPNQTNYGKRPQLPEQSLPLNDNFREYKVMYLAYDITNLLHKGENAMGSILGNGFYNPSKFWAAAYGSPRFIGQIHISYSDGTQEIIVSDQSWKASKSAITMDMVYFGEHYDARLEQAGWCEAGFDDSEWESVAIRKAPEGKLVAHTALPDRVTQQISPKSIVKLENGKYLVDFGVEISGWLRLNNITGASGNKIDIKYLCNQYSGDNTYTCKGGGPESYAARFNWFVFSAVEITNWPGELKAENLTAEAVNTPVEKTATFETSNQLFNQINEVWQRSQLDNMHGGIASDCPHRERSAYTGDGQVACVTVMHNFDTRAFYRKWIQDIWGAQDVETGYVPNSAPWQPGCGGGVAWGAAIVIMPWEYYVHYGDLDILADNYDAMKEYIRYMKTWVNEEGIMFSQRLGKDGKPLQWFNLGEWCYPGDQVSDELVHTFYFWRCADLTAKIAGVLGNNADAAIYAELAEKTKHAFHKKFYNEENGSYGKGGGNIFALKMGVPENRFEQVIMALKEDIKANDGHLDTGIFGTQFFFEILTENGLHELAYEAMKKETQPGFGYWIKQGATTTWEDWDGHGSHNHPMFGGGLSWFYRKLAGMEPDPLKPGYRHIIFNPHPVDELTYVTYSNITVQGKAGITWENEQNKFTMEVNVPVGSIATVHIPCSDINKLKESTQSIDDCDGLKIESVSDNEVLVSVESGTYHFEVNK